MQSQLSTQNLINYSENTIKRAERALSCSSFQLSLFQSMKDNSVPLPEMTGNHGIKHNYIKNNLTENQVERQLLWLIKVGLLRREVDGQGITDSFRLTPLGRQLVAKYESENHQIPIPTFWDKMSNTLNRLFSFLG